MANKGRSEPNLFGGYTHYDEKGNKIGTSEPGFFGGFTEYDAKGNKIGYTDPGLLGGYTHYDSHGNKTGRSDPSLLGGYTHYDKNGNRSGSSDPNLLGGYSHSDSEGCYIATCVYGSYDSPQVWTLRRFRDDTLKQSAAGRAFVRVYYAVSPTFVRCFGHTKVFQRFWRGQLDRLVKRLNDKGINNAEYEFMQ